MPEMDSQEKVALELASMEVINFTNIDTEPFDAKWGGVVEVIDAGETVPRPRFKALHYTHHLVNKILIRKKVSWTSSQDRKPLEIECLGEVEAGKIERFGKAAPAPAKVIQAEPDVKTKKKGEAKKPESPDSEGSPDDKKTDKIDDYNKDFTVKELEDLIEARGLEVPDGKKSVLVKFLTKDDKAKEGQSEGQPETPTEGAEDFEEVPKDDETENKPEE